MRRGASYLKSRHRKSRPFTERILLETLLLCVLFLPKYFASTPLLSLPIMAGLTPIKDKGFSRVARCSRAGPVQEASSRRRDSFLVAIHAVEWSDRGDAAISL